MNEFQKQRAEKKKEKIFITIIIILLFMNLFTVKGLISVSSNKTVVVQVPQVLDPGEYAIGATASSESVYTMWSKVWVTEIGNFNYSDVRKKISSLFPFLGGPTAINSKSKLIKFISFNENNFISQELTIKDTMFEKLNNGYVKVSVIAKVHKKVGKKEDALSGLLFVYEFTMFTKNGQVYISGVSTDIANANDPSVKARLQAIPSINVEESLILSSEADEKLKKKFSEYKTRTLEEQHNEKQKRLESIYNKVKKINNKEGK